MDAYKLREEIKNVLGTRKCLFVLDDVWNMEVYHQMMEDIFNTLRASCMKGRPGAVGEC
jgi:hypothetical protein